MLEALEDWIAAWLGRASGTEVLVVAAIVLVGTGVLVGAIVGLLGSWTARRRRSKLFRLLSDAGLDVGTASFREPREGLPEEILDFSYQGMRFSLRCMFASRDPSPWRLQTPAGAGVELQVVRRTSGVSENDPSVATLSTGDAAFDADYVLSSDPPEFAASFFQDAERRRRVRELSALGCEQTDVGDGFLTLDLGQAPPARLKDLVEAAAALAAALPRGGEPIAPARKFPAVSVFGTVLAVVLCLDVAFRTSSLAHLGMRSLDMTFTNSLPYTLPWAAALLAILLAWPAARKRLLVREKPLSLVVPMIFTVASVYMGARVLNEALDRGDAAFHVVRVVDRLHYWVRGKHASEHYKLVVQSWRNGRRSEAIEVSPGEYGRATPWQTWVRIGVKPGWLGFAWTQSIEIAQEPSLRAFAVDRASLERAFQPQNWQLIQDVPFRQGLRRATYRTSEYGPYRAYGLLTDGRQVFQLIDGIHSALLDHLAVGCQNAVPAQLRAGCRVSVVETIIIGDLARLSGAEMATPETSRRSMATLRSGATADAAGRCLLVLHTMGTYEARFPAQGLTLTCIPDKETLNLNWSAAARL